jgi:hypothetical protein
LEICIYYFWQYVIGELHLEHNSANRSIIGMCIRISQVNCIRIKQAPIKKKNKTGSKNQRQWQRLNSNYQLKLLNRQWHPWQWHMLSSTCVASQAA